MRDVCDLILCADVGRIRDGRDHDGNVMPVSKQVIDGYGMVVVYEETTTTQWVQMVGEAMVRCDDEAKETGRGAWIVSQPGRTQSWYGGEPANLLGGAKIDPTLWIRDGWVRKTEYEKDVS